MLTLAAILAIVVIAATYGLDSYNTLVKLLDKGDEAYVTVDGCLKERYNLIQNIVSAVNEYAEGESETLEKLLQAKDKAQKARTIDDKAEGENELTECLASVFALSEKHPELKANGGFGKLQNELDSINEEIAAASKSYNDLVIEYNKKRKVFPHSIVAGIFKFDEMGLFEISGRE